MAGVIGSGPGLGIAGVSPAVFGVPPNTRCRPAVNPLGETPSVATETVALPEVTHSQSHQNSAAPGRIAFTRGRISLSTFVCTKMKKASKPILYVVFAILAITFAILAAREFGALFDTASHRYDTPGAEAAPDAGVAEGGHFSPSFAKAIIYLIGFVGSLIGLGLLLGRDASKILGSRFFRSMAGDERVTQADPDYEAAELVWADGNHLEAIRLMREYHQRKPNEIYAMIRIAEIYEKDLRNHLAAALEYEEILKVKLTPERWAWSAIHLCNLYFKLNQSEQAVALLHRIDAEYGETAAADKARKRLALIASGGETSAPAQTAGIEEETPTDPKAE